MRELSPKELMSIRISSLRRAFREITSTIKQQIHLYNFHLKHCKTLKTTPTYAAYEADLANYTLYNKIPTQHDTLPQHLVYKNKLNHEYVITLARNNETSWWWSEKIETGQSGFKCFKWKLYRCICWLIVEVMSIYLTCTLYFCFSVNPKHQVYFNNEIRQMIESTKRTIEFRNS